VDVEHAFIEPRNSRLVVLPAGTPPVNPLELLRSEDLATVFSVLRRSFDLILVDTPPTVPFADAAVVAPHADAAVLVVRSRTTAKPLCTRRWRRWVPSPCWEQCSTTSATRRSITPLRRL
jgi:Mrp family chromosome partitioning ATPase